MVNPNPSAVTVTVAPAQRRRRAGRLPLHARRQQPADHLRQRPAAVPQRQLRDDGHRVAAGLRRARHVLARLRGRPRRDRRRRASRRRGASPRASPAATSRPTSCSPTPAAPRSRRRSSFFLDNGAVVTKTVCDRAEQPPAPSASATTPSCWTRRSPRASAPARRSSPSGRCTGAASSRGTRPPGLTHRTRVGLRRRPRRCARRPELRDVLPVPQRRASPIDVTGSFYREDGYGTRQTYTIPANSRFTLYGAAVPHMNGQKFGAVFEGSAPVHRRARGLLGRRPLRRPRLAPARRTRAARGHAGRAAHAAARRHRRRRRRSARRSSATTCRARRSARSSAAASTASATSSPTSAPASSGRRADDHAAATSSTS